MNKILKYLLSTTISLALISSFGFAEYSVLHTENDENYIAQGVMHSNQRILTEKGWINLNILTVDLRKDVEIKTLYPDSYISKKSKLSNLAAEEENIIGAINADFFDYATKSAFGPIIDDSEIITSSINDSKFASFNISDKGVPFINYWNDMSMTLKTGTGYEMRIEYKNKPYLSYDRAIIFDHNWSSKSFGNTIDIPVIEVVVQNDVIISIAENPSPQAIPEGGYIISAVGTMYDEVKNNLKIGDRLQIINQEPIDAVDLSIGGGSQLIKDGQLSSKYTLDVSGYHPRTALGITQNNTKLIMVTADGRTSNFRGLSQYELSEIMLKLGAYNAINFDGGGSSEMIAKNAKTGVVEIKNYPSDKTERYIHNGLGISSTAEEGLLSKIHINETREELFIGIPVELSISGFDSKINPITIDPEEIKWSTFENTGTFDGNVFTATTKGKVTIIAEYKGFKDALPLLAHDDIIDLALNIEEIRLLKNEQTKLTVSGVTDTGHYIALDPTNVIWSIPEGAGHLDTDGVFTAADVEGQSYITVAINGVKKHIPVVIGEKKTLIYDFETTTPTFDFYPETVKGEYQQIKFSNNPDIGPMGGRLIFDFSGPEKIKGAYMVFNPEETTLSGYPDKIGVNVYGTYSNGHILKGIVKDATGKKEKIVFGRMEYEGWNYVEAEIPKGLVEPLVFDQLYAAEDDMLKQDKSVIVADNIYSVAAPEITIALPADVNRLPNLADSKVDFNIGDNSIIYGKFNNKNTYDDETINAITGFNSYFNLGYFASSVPADLKDANWNIIATDNYTESIINGSMVVTLKSRNKSFIKKDATQLSKLMYRINNFDYKSLVIVTNDTLSFYDPFEEKLFFEQLDKLYNKGVNVYIVESGNSKSYKTYLKNSATVVRIKESNDVNINALLMNIDNDGEVTFEQRLLK